MYQYDINKQLFCDYQEKEKEIFSKNYLLDQQTNVIELENGIILPIKQTPNDTNEGGVCNSNGEFVAGFYNDMINKDENNTTHNCRSTYKFSEKPIKVNETVIFGGMLFGHFGHFLRDCITRLWYIVQNPKIEYKIVFLNKYNNNIVPFKNILETLGLTEDRYELITEPTQFDKIIIPDQSCDVANGYTKEFQLIFDKIISQTKPSSLKKVYLSKSRFIQNKTVNETYFEEFYRKRGFEIIYPEALEFLKQVSIINGADEIVCTAGTLVHLTYFSKNNSRITILGRTDDTFRNPDTKTWLFSLQMRDIESYFVDVSYNFLPVTFNGGIFMLGPTKHWINYLDSQNISYKPDEVSFDIHVKPYVYDYLIEWAKNYNKNQKSYAIIKNAALPNVINTIYQAFLDETIDINKFPDRGDVVNIKRHANALSSQLQKAKAINHTNQLDALTQKLNDLEKNYSTNVVVNNMKFY